MTLSLLRSRRFWILLFLALIVAVVLALRSTPVKVVLEALTPARLPDIEAPKQRVYLSQNWSEKRAHEFHFISQGTSTLPIPYDWLLALEQPENSPWGLLWPGAKDLFVSPDYLRKFGFIPAETSPRNPAGLPIGFATTPFQNLAGYPTTTTAVGFTCAACHTGHFQHEDTEYIVDGGPALTDLQGFSQRLAAALGQTVLAGKLPLPNKRFDRFAKRVLGPEYSEASKARLSTNLQSVVTTAAALSDVIAVTEGYGRLDALNRIGNQVFAKNIGRWDNYTPVNAPVNYPHIWTASWFDWVQYDGSIMQPLVRNSGEALGVHANINVTAPGSERFASSVPVENMKWIEDVLGGDTAPYPAREFGGLQAPKWPAALGAIDTALAEKGANLYHKHCQGCHLPPLTSDAIWSDRYFQKIVYERGGQRRETRESFLALTIKDLRIIGTDPAQANILDQRTINTAADPATGRAALGVEATVCAPAARFSGAQPQYAASKLDRQVSNRGKLEENKLVEVDVTDGPMVNFALALGAIVQRTNDWWFDANAIPSELRPYFEGERPNCLQKGAGYKARPLNGVWATGPFLHNGSVPTLDDLLRPADQRPRFVRLGDPAFDPVKVGVLQPVLDEDSYPPYRDGYFILDTAIPGNLNTGHAFGASADGDKRGVIGPEFTDQDRRALIEYLKTL